MSDNPFLLGAPPHTTQPWLSFPNLKYNANISSAHHSTQLKRGVHSSLYSFFFQSCVIAR